MPFFFVETKDVIRRLLYSMIPGIGMRRSGIIGGHSGERSAFLSYAANILLTLIQCFVLTAFARPGGTTQERASAFWSLLICMVH